jgi:hypothetical protein
MNNKNLLMIGGGCLALLLLCVCIGGVTFVVAGNAINDTFNQIQGQLGNTDTELPSGLPPIGQPPDVVPPVGQPPSVSTRVSQPAPTQPATTGGSTTGGNLFADAANKMKSAQKYRLEFSWVFGGMENGKYQEQPFFDMTGMVDNNKSYFTSKGGLLAMLASDKNAAIEIIEADGKSYMKGINMFGMTDPKVWYISDGSSTSGFKDFAKPDEYKSFAGGKDSDFKKTRSESVDGLSCDVWVYDFKSTQNSALTGLLGSAKDKGDFSAIDRADVSTWLCSDGFVHKYVVDYEGHDAKDATQKGALKINAHMFDFNNAGISVTAPKDAKPMPGSK